MTIYRLHRPWLKGLFGGFPQRRHHISRRLAAWGYPVRDYEIRPVRTPSVHLSYLLGMLRSLLAFRVDRAALVIAEDVECGLFAVLLRLVHRTPFVFDFIDDYAAIIRHDRQPLRYVLARWVEVLAPRLARVVVAVDRKKVQFCRRIGVPPRKVRLVPNGYDTGLFRPSAGARERFPDLDLENSRILLYVGKLNRYYHIDVLIRAAALVAAERPDTLLLLVGEGDDQARLEKLSREAGVEVNIRFCGYRPHGEIPALINLADICLFPLADESALALLEYMACAKPVIAPAGGTSKMEITREQFPEDCLIRVDNSPRGFARAILDLLDDAQRARQLGANARRRVASGCDWDTISTAYRRAIDAALAGGDA
jgi:glycosyltransferase involved in cell wall biosynthesis